MAVVLAREQEQALPLGRVLVLALVWQPQALELALAQLLARALVLALVGAQVLAHSLAQLLLE